VLFRLLHAAGLAVDFQQPINEVAVLDIGRFQQRLFDGFAKQMRPTFAVARNSHAWPRRR